MPFCTQCGSNVDAAAAFCSNCGSRQHASSSSTPFNTGADPLGRLNDRTAAILCYLPIIGVFACGFILASQRFRHNSRIRFDGFQGLYLFVAWLIVSSAFPALFIGILAPHHLLGLMKLFLVGVWIYLLIQASSGKQVRLPVIGDLAARSIVEQQ